MRVVYLAEQSDLAYSLPAAAAAGARGGPVLLTVRDVLPTNVANELIRLRPVRIIALGGTSHVSSAVLTKLRRYSHIVTRQAGGDQFATAAIVSAASFAPGAPVAYIARYDDYPTMFAAAAAAGARGGPVLLTSRGSLTGVTARELRRLRPARIVVAGGTGAVSDAVLSTLRRYAPRVSRQAGADRYATAAALARAAYPNGSSLAFVGSGVNIADGGTGAAAAAKLHRPLLLTAVAAASAPTKAALLQQAPGGLVDPRRCDRGFSGHRDRARWCDQRRETETEANADAQAHTHRDTDPGIDRNGNARDACPHTDGHADTDADAERAVRRPTPTPHRPRRARSSRPSRRRSMPLRRGRR